MREIINEYKTYVTMTTQNSLPQKMTSTIVDPFNSKNRFYLLKNKAKLILQQRQTIIIKRKKERKKEKDKRKKEIRRVSRVFLDKLCL